MIKYLLTGTLLTFSVYAKESKIEVQGRCEIKVIPDRGRVTVTAENQHKDQKTAVEKTNIQINTLKEKIKNLNLPNLELKNGQYNVFPVREYEKERYVDKGIKASLSLDVTTSDVAGLGEVLLEASKVGIKNVGQLETFLSQEKSQSEYLKCLDIASQDAKGKANLLASKLGFKIGDVIHVVESPNSNRSPETPPVMFKTSMAQSMTPTQIEAGQQQFSTTLQVTFKIK